MFSVSVRIQNVCKNLSQWRWHWKEYSHIPFLCYHARSLWRFVTLALFSKGKYYINIETGAKVFVIWLINRKKCKENSSWFIIFLLSFLNVHIYFKNKEINLTFLLILVLKIATIWPKDWKLQEFVVLHKSGDIKECNNYRTITC